MNDNTPILNHKSGLAMKRIRLLLTILLTLFFTAWFPRGNPLILSPGWHTLLVGAGGYQTLITFSASGNTALIRNDDGDGYRWDATAGKWMLMNTAANTPNSSTQPYNINNTPMVYEVAVAPNDDNRVYMLSVGMMLKSTDGGRTFSNLVNFPQIDASIPGVGVNSQFRLSGPRMVVDPVNADNFYYCSSSAGLFHSTDGGTSFTHVTNVPSPIPVNSTTSFTTNGVTAAGNNVLNFSSITPPVVGSYVYDSTSNLAIPGGAQVIAATSTTITINLNVNAPGVGIGDTIKTATNGHATSVTNSTTAAGNNILHFAAAINNGSPFVGMAILDLTNPSAIPPFTNVWGADASTFAITMSQNATGTVGLGDTIIFVGGGNPDAWPSCTVSFDQTSSVAGTTNGAWVFPAGAGVYHTTDNGATWALAAAGGPTTYPVQMYSGSDGKLWVVSSPADTPGSCTVAGSNVWKLASSTWTRPSCNTLGNNQAVGVLAIDPSDPNHIITTEMNESIDGGVTFDGVNCGFCNSPSGGADRYATGDIGWLETSDHPLMAESTYAFNPANGRLYVSEGTGVWWANPPGCHCAFHWNAQSAGIEDLTTNQIVVSPSSNGQAVIASWDRPVMLSSALASLQGKYPSTITVTKNADILMGWGLDWASSSPSTICLLSDYGLAGNLGDRSGCSADNGTTWNIWKQSYPTYNSPVSPLMTVASDAASGQANITVSNVPGNVRIGQKVFTTNYHLLTTTAQTATSSAVLHFGAGNIPADLAVKVSGSFIYSFISPFPYDASPHTGILYTIQIGGIFSCVNITGADCAGTAAGDITLVSNVRATIPAGTVLWFASSATMPASDAATVSNIVGNVITLSLNLRQTLSTGAVINIDATSNGGIGGGSLAVATPNNIIVAPGDNSQWLWYTKDGGKTWNPVIIANATTCSGGGACPGFNADGSAISDGGTFGWGGAYYANVKLIAADRVNIGTFYVHNCRTKAGGGGIYMSTDNGDTWTRTYDETLAISFCQTDTKLMTVPGNAGHFYFSGGPGANRGLFKTTNGGSNLTAVPGTGPPTGNFTLGAIAPGKTYPTLYYTGVSGGVHSIFRATNAEQATPTFVDINSASQKVNGTMHGIGSCMEGDPIVYGRIYGCTGGMGYVWGDFQNFLLKRDLDPAANDNYPAFMNMVG